jgi:hypothetical protein
VFRSLLVMLGLVLSLTACGGGDSGDDAPASSAAAVAPSTQASEAAATGTAAAATSPASSGSGASAATLTELLGLETANVETDDVALPGGADLPVGEPARIPFLLLDKGGAQREVAGDRMTLYVAKDATSPVYGPFEARREKIEAEGAVLHENTVSEIWVGTINVPEAGPHVLVATYDSAEGPLSAQAPIQILERESTPPVGAAAPASDTPTLESTGGDFAALTTSEQPYRFLYEHSVAETLEAGKPFVLIFATPKFCTSRLCGPVVEIAATAKQELERKDVRFIHVEIYEGNDPQNGVNRWVQEWALPTEPWVFLVGADGKIAAKFEGAVSRRELDAALAELPPPSA